MNVVVPSSFDSDVVPVLWLLTDLEGLSVVGDCCEIGLRIPNEIHFPKAFRSVLQGDSAFVIRGRDAFL